MSDPILEIESLGEISRTEGILSGHPQIFHGEARDIPPVQFTGM
jgi:hypothetical protein